MTTPATRLVEYLASLTESALEPQLTQSATLSLLDSIACGLYGSQQQWGKIVNDFVLSEQSRGTATLYGSQTPVAPARAALANGTSTHGFELDDILHQHSHPGAVVVSAALAVAEHTQASGAQLLLGLIAGYEMMGRLGSALGMDTSHRGYHITGVAGTVAATVAAGVVMRMNAAQMLSAIGNACSASAGIKAFTQGTGGMAKRMHAGRAAESGVVACELARRGFTGPMQGIDGRFGLLEVIAGSGARPKLLENSLGTNLEITQTWVKVYPCCGVIHSVMHALESLKEEHQFPASAVREIRVHIHRRGVTQNGDPDPRETMAAQYSIPFCAGVALTKNPRDPEAFADRNLQDPLVRGLASRTKLFEDAAIEQLYPEHLAARIELSLSDGRELTSTVHDPRGSQLCPCTPTDIEDKFRRLAGSVKRPETVERIIAEVRGLASNRTVADLSSALREANL